MVAVWYVGGVGVATMIQIVNMADHNPCKVVLRNRNKSGHVVLSSQTIHLPPKFQLSDPLLRQLLRVQGHYRPRFLLHHAVITQKLSQVLVEVLLISRHTNFLHPPIKIRLNLIHRIQSLNLLEALERSHQLGRASIVLLSTRLFHQRAAYHFEMTFPWER